MNRTRHKTRGRQSQLALMMARIVSWASKWKMKREKWKNIWKLKRRFCNQKQLNTLIACALLITYYIYAAEARKQTQFNGSVQIDIYSCKLKLHKFTLLDKQKLFLSWLSRCWCFCFRFCFWYWYCWCSSSCSCHRSDRVRTMLMDYQPCSARRAFIKRLGAQPLVSAKRSSKSGAKIKLKYASVTECRRNEKKIKIK